MTLLYLLVIGGFFCFIIQKNSDSQNNSQLPVLIMFGGLLFISACRDISVGYDTTAYITHYESEIYSFEPLFNLVQLICFKLKLSENGFLAVTSLLALLPLFLIIKKDSQLPILSLLGYICFSVFFYTNSMNVIRNAIACSFFIVYLHFVTKKQWLYAIIFAIVAVLFHFSAFFPIVFSLCTLFIRQLSNKVIVISVVLSLIIGQVTSFYADAVNIAINNFDRLFFIEKYNNYLSDLYSAQYNNVGKMMALAPNIICLFLASSSNTRNTLYYKVFFVGVIITNLFINIQFIYRISLYLVLCQVFALPTSYSECKINKKYIIDTFLVLMMLFFIFYTSKSDSGGVYPISFFWEH